MAAEYRARRVRTSASRSAEVSNSGSSRTTRRLQSKATGHTGTAASRAMRQKPVFQRSTRRRVPSGVMARKKASSRNEATAASITPSGAWRFTGMPPSHRMSHPKGGPNSASLPRKRKRKPRARAAKTPTMKSQFEVWGATTITTLGRSGTSPSKRQPSRPMPKAPRPRVRGLPRRGTRGPREGTLITARILSRARPRLIRGGHLDARGYAAPNLSRVEPSRKSRAAAIVWPPRGSLHRYRRLILLGRLALAHDAARRLVGPDCAYHLYGRGSVQLANRGQGRRRPAGEASFGRRAGRPRGWRR